MSESVKEFEKLECLRAHYSSSSVQMDSIPYGIKKGNAWDRLNDDQKGQLCMTSLETACRKLSIEEFVLEGLPLPVIKKCESYEEHFLLIESERMDELTDVRESKSSLVEMLSRRLEEETAEVGRAREVLQNLDGDSKKKEVDLAEMVLRSARQAVGVCVEALDKAKSERSECGERVAKLKEGAKAKARRRYDEDQEAMVRLRRCLNLLGSYVEKIFQDFRLFEEKCRDFGTWNYDPFKAEEYYRVYLNLVRAYKCEDQLSVVGYIVSVMRKPMQDANLAKFRTSIEDFLAQLRDLKVDSISLSDLASLVFLLNVKDEHRKEFFKNENMLKLTAEGLGHSDDEEIDGADGGDVGSLRSRRMKKDLFGRVRDYCKQIESQEKLNKSFAKGTEDAEKKLHKQQQRNDAEAREVMAIGKSKKSPCFAFQKGECSRGADCRFAHETEQTASKGPCWNFAKGTCQFGKACRFEHVIPGKDDVTAGGTGGAAAGSSTTGSSKSNVNVVKKAHKNARYRDKDRDDIPNSEDSSVESHVVTVSNIANVCSVATGEAKPMSMKINWDTASTDHCTRDPRILSDGYDELQNMTARGVGGLEPITAVGDSGIFQLEGMLLLPNAQIPNILSVGKDTQLQPKTRPMVYILDHEGGTRLRADKEDLRVLKRLVERARAAGRVVGEALVESGVYVEDFGKKTEKRVSAEKQRPVSTYSVTKLYGGRVQLDSVQGCIGMLVAAGLNVKALEHATEYGTILGLPKSVTKTEISDYMQEHGRELAQLEAGIVQAPLVHPKDYVHDAASEDGEIMVMDAVKPSYSYMSSNIMKDGVAKIIKVEVPAIGGYHDYVSIADEHSGYAVCIGRTTKKCPEEMVKKAALSFVVRWRNLRKVKADKEFVTKAAINMLETISAENKLQRMIEMKMPPPGDHRRVIGSVEGGNRWKQQTAQASLNRLDPLVEQGIITERERTSFWLFASQLAHVLSNAMPSKTNPFESRYQAGTGRPFNLSIIPILPLGMRLVGKKLRNDERGRGEEILYMGSSEVCDGGIKGFSLRTRSMSCKYAFIACDHLPVLTEADILGSQRALYGELLRVVEDVPSNLSGQSYRDDTDDASGRGVTEAGAEMTEPTLAETKKDGAVGAAREVPVPSSGVGADKGSTSGEEMLITRPKREFKIRPHREDEYAKVYKARDRALAVRQIEVCTAEVRPPKPIKPSKQQARRSLEWTEAYTREYQKFLDEKCYLPLEKNEKGGFILPDDAIVMDIIDLFDHKWKEWPPGSGTMKWLEVVRAVLNGSQDPSTKSYYAETPSRTVLLIMISCGLSSGCITLVSDAVRAYLKALSIERNLVVRLPDCVLHMGFEKLMLVNKGVYGTKSGALSWEVFFESKAVAKLGFSKCVMAASVYCKDVEGDIVRMLRHSDDVMIQGKLRNLVEAECGKLSLEIEMSPWAEMELFLGAEIEVFGNVACLRQRGKILEGSEKFGELIVSMNPKRRVRNSPLPSNALEEDDCLHPDELKMCSKEEITVYQEIVGLVNWICSIRQDGKFAYSVIAERQSKPRKWDTRCAVWFLEFLVNTVDWPLVLGGDTIDFSSKSDASHGNRKERRSTVGAILRTGPLSGAVLAESSVIKVAVTAVFDAELIGGSRAIDMLQFGLNMCADLKYENLGSRIVTVDSESVVEWFDKKKINSRSRHVQIKYYHIRHSVQEGLCCFGWEEGGNNETDMLTKVMSVRGNTTCARKLLGHCLLQGRGIAGIIELDNVDIMVLQSHCTVVHGQLLRGASVNEWGV